jgi:hypothetical protein
MNLNVPIEFGFYCPEKEAFLLLTTNFTAETRDWKVSKSKYIPFGPFTTYTDKSDAIKKLPEIRETFPRAVIVKITTQFEPE